MEVVEDYLQSVRHVEGNWWFCGLSLMLLIEDVVVVRWEAKSRQRHLIYPSSLIEHASSRRGHMCK